jgi:hypothetical protein
MINGLLQELGIHIIRQEGGKNGTEIICRCPFCDGKDKLSVNADIPLWKCWHVACGKSGNYYELIDELSFKSPVEIKEMLSRYGLDMDDARKHQAKPAGPPKITADELRIPTPQELQELCTEKGLQPEALVEFQPRRYKNKPVIAMPAYNPATPEKPCGWLRVAQNGGDVFPGKKSPMVKGSKHGLLGYKWIMEQGPKQILLCEGWGDAIAAIGLGFIATASTGGASKWDNDWLPIFAGRDAVLIFDRDKAGQIAQDRAANNIYSVAKSVKIVELPYEVVEKHGLDLRDYIGCVA